jgi:predicted nucleotidyltransferase
MDKKDILKTITQFKKILETKGIQINQIILYGSWASRQQREESDIDLVVISKDFESKGYWERVNIISDAIYEVFAPIEAVALTPEEWEKKDSLICEYARGGEVIRV